MRTPVTKMREGEELRFFPTPGIDHGQILVRVLGGRNGYVKIGYHSHPSVRVEKWSMDGEKKSDLTDHAARQACLDAVELDARPVLSHNSQ